MCGTHSPTGLDGWFSNGGGIPLEHCTSTDDGRRCALEYNVVRWGRTEIPPEAGVAVYVRGVSGRLAAARIYDDSDMPLVFFVAPKGPRMLGTLDAINRSPRDGGLVSNGLVHRYDVEKSPDGLQGDEGTFSLCTFWLVEALTRAGRVEEARMIFEQMLSYANHVGLYAEEIGPSGEALGNFPQAFTHLTLISAAFNLDRALGARG